LIGPDIGTARIRWLTHGAGKISVAFPTEGDIAGMATTWSKIAHFFKNGPTK
jgi:hypothetical protein